MVDDRLTHSQRLCFMSCPQMHEHRYVSLIRPAEDGKALRMGSAFHAAQEAVNQRHPMTSVSIWELAGREIDRVYKSLEMEGRDYAYEIAQVRAMVRGYVERWQDQPWEFVAAEQRLEGPIINPASGRPMRAMRNAGKADGIIRWDGDRLALLEYKTTSEDLAADSFLWEHYGLSSQPLSYLSMARHAGWDVTAVVYDVTRKPLLRPRQIPILDDEGHKVVVDAEGGRVYLNSGKPRQAADSQKGWTVLSETETPHEYEERIAEDMRDRPEHYFARRQIPVLSQDQAGAAYDTWAIAKNIMAARADSRWPKNTNHCTAYGRCPYLPLCLANWQEGDPLPENFYRSTTAHPELDHA